MALVIPPKFRILVVDDTSLARHAVISSLKELGFTADDLEEASDGQGAFLKIRKARDARKPFQLVLCDWNMPELDGLDLLKTCRRSYEFSKLPFVMITAEASQKKITEALMSGCLDYITKPFSMETLKSKIEKAVTSFSAQ